MHINEDVAYVWNVLEKNITFDEGRCGENYYKCRAEWNQPATPYSSEDKHLYFNKWILTYTLYTGTKTPLDKANDGILGSSDDK